MSVIIMDGGIAPRAAPGPAAPVHAVVVLAVAAGVVTAMIIMQGIVPYVPWHHDWPWWGGDARTLMDKSVPYVGTGPVRAEGYTGKGVRIAVIDTGVDFTHPDLAGGQGRHGYDFIGGGGGDKNGHGTQVAGIIAAGGDLVGVAPDATVLSYRVSDYGESVSTDLITRAIERAIRDKADIINISLGINKTNAAIESAVGMAIREGIFVVLAAGNDGPWPGTISSPGRSADAVTVGATYNNITSNIVATLQVGGKQYQVIPMEGTDDLRQSVSGKVALGGYGRVQDLHDGHAGTILLVERGSDVEGELVYFAEKEYNAAQVGASAVIVYNNEPGLYLGDVSSSITIPDYAPQIPIVSMSQEDGHELRREVRREVAAGPEAVLDVFYNPDYVGHFSSRGPVSPFYIKPDLVAPGIFVNSTDIGGAYNMTTGTSFAAPHVAGAAALLLERDPSLTPAQLKSLLVTTASPIIDAYGDTVSVLDAGAGRLDVQNAFAARLVFEPVFLIMVFSQEEDMQKGIITVRDIVGRTDMIHVEIEAPESADITHEVDDNAIIIHARMDDAEIGMHEGAVKIRHDNASYRIPIILEYVGGSVSVQNDDGVLSFDVTGPQDWHYAKITATSAINGASQTVSVTPGLDPHVRAGVPGTYWIESAIMAGDMTHMAYDVVHVQSAASSLFELPDRHYLILCTIMVILGLAVLAYRKARMHDSATTAQPPITTI